MQQQTVIRMEAMADRVMIRFYNVAESRYMELELPVAQLLLSRLADVIAEAKAFEPGAKSFEEWKL